MKTTKASRPSAKATATLLQPSKPEALQWDMQQVQLGIARRAYELFEARNREHGHDWEDWFQAESELLRPVSIAMSESADRFSVRANVLGLEADELRVSIEPTKITILGQKKLSAPEGQKAVSDFYPDQVLRSIDIASEVDPDGAVVELEAGILKFELPKVVKTEVKIAVAGSE
jgi:HSP20 family molecular chaperone IbpA